MSTPPMGEVPQLPAQLPLYDPQNAQQRMQIRSGQADPVGAKQYRRSKSGAYEMARDPNRTVNQPMQDEVRNKGYDYGTRQHNAISQATGIDNQVAQDTMASMWDQERLRQEEEYAAYYAEAQQYAAQPFRYNITTPDGQSNSGWSFQMLDTNGLGEIRTKIVNSAVNAAQSGLAYSWGGGGIGGPSKGVLSPGGDGRGTFGFDCSGLVQFAYGQAGIQLPRVSRQQASTGMITSINRLKPGDIVGWGNNPQSAYHVAVFIGNGYIAEAAGVGKGMRVRRLSDAEMRGQGAFGVSILGN